MFSSGSESETEVDGRESSGGSDAAPLLTLVSLSTERVVPDSNSLRPTETRKREWGGGAGFGSVSSVAGGLDLLSHDLLRRAWIDCVR